MENDKTETPEPLSAEEIVAGLRADDKEQRQAAVDALFPREGGELGGMVIKLHRDSGVVTMSQPVAAGNMFNVLLQVCEFLGGHLGLELKWTQKPVDASKLVIPPGI